MSVIPVGAVVQITKKGHWAYGKRVRVSSLPTIEIAGLDLGELIAFQAINHFDEVDEHVVSRDWCQQVEASVVSIIRASDAVGAEPTDAEEADQQMEMFG